MERVYILSEEDIQEASQFWVSTKYKPNVALKAQIRTEEVGDGSDKKIVVSVIVKEEIAKGQ